jgi:hypothetical protein
MVPQRKTLREIINTINCCGFEASQLPGYSSGKATTTIGQLEKAVMYVTDELTHDDLKQL